MIPTRRPPPARSAPPPGENSPGTNGSLVGLRGRNVEAPGYSGPLDLLLQLIRKNEVDIYDIPIASITDQYLVELNTMEQQDLVVAGDFLLMAATLLEIKSAMMLPRPAPLLAEDESLDPRAELTQRLLEYHAIQEAAEQLGRLEGRRRLLFGRGFVPSAIQEFKPLAAPLANLSQDRLMQSLQAVMERMLAESPPVTSLPRQALTLHRRVSELLAELTAGGQAGVPFNRLLAPHRGRWYVIVSFLALLEILRLGRAAFHERGPGYHFWINLGSSGARIAPPDVAESHSADGEGGHSSGAVI